MHAKFIIQQGISAKTIVYKNGCISKIFRYFETSDVNGYEHKYYLTAIITHSSLHKSGHYVIYIRTAGQYWVCANDSMVTKTEQEELFHKISGEDAIDEMIEHDPNFQYTVKGLENLMLKIRCSTLVLYQKSYDALDETTKPCFNSNHLRNLVTKLSDLYNFL